MMMLFEIVESLHAISEVPVWLFAHFVLEA